MQYILCSHQLPPPPLFKLLHAFAPSMNFSNLHVAIPYIAQWHTPIVSLMSVLLLDWGGCGVSDSMGLLCCQTLDMGFIYCCQTPTNIGHLSQHTRTYALILYFYCE